MTSALLFHPAPLRFRVARPDAKKNRGMAIRMGDGARYLPNPIALRQEKLIRKYLEQTVEGAHPLFGADDVGVTVIYRPRIDELEVQVEHIQPRPRGYTGRRSDLANVSEVLLDALQGPVIGNDNQVARLVMVREL